MARILGGGTFGELRGKLGGQVFARNKAGAYVRQYVKPIDPRSIAQIIARSKFGMSSNNYHMLEAGTKTLWENFAQTIFRPKNGEIGIQSGFNAYVSLLNAVNNAQLPGEVSYKFNGVLATIPTKTKYEFSSTPPEKGLLMNFSDNGTPIPFVFRSFNVVGFEIDSTRWKIRGSVICDFVGPIDPTQEISDFIDTNDNNFGFAIYMSNPVAQPGMFIANPNKYLIGYLEAGELTTPLTPGSSLEIAFQQLDYYLSDYKSLPNYGQYVQLTCYQVSTTGMFNKVGSYMVSVHA